MPEPNGRVLPWREGKAQQRRRQVQELEAKVERLEQAMIAQQHTNQFLFEQIQHTQGLQMQHKIDGGVLLKVMTQAEYTPLTPELLPALRAAVVQELKELEAAERLVQFLRVQHGRNPDGSEIEEVEAAPDA